MAFIPDPTREIQNRIRELAKSNQATMDNQELAEREEAADAYAGENEKHFVDYGEDCKNASVKAKVNVRRIQKEC